MNYSTFIDKLEDIKATLELLASPSIPLPMQIAGAKQIETELANLLQEYRVCMVNEGIRKRKGKAPAVPAAPAAPAVPAVPAVPDVVAAAVSVRNPFVLPAHKA